MSQFRLRIQIETVDGIPIVDMTRALTTPAEFQAAGFSAWNVHLFQEAFTRFISKASFGVALVQSLVNVGALIYGIAPPRKRKSQWTVELHDGSRYVACIVPPDISKDEV